MPEGTIFHSVTYGKNNMGSYASQLSREQRWMVVQYVKAYQTGKLNGAAATDSTGTTGATKDSTATKVNDSTKTK